VEGWGLILLLGLSPRARNSSPHPFSTFFKVTNKEKKKQKKKYDDNDESLAFL